MKLFAKCALRHEQRTFEKHIYHCGRFNNHLVISITIHTSRTTDYKTARKRRTYLSRRSRQTLHVRSRRRLHDDSSDVNTVELRMNYST